MRNKGLFKTIQQYGGAKEKSFSPDRQPGELGLREAYLPVHTRCSKSNKWECNLIAHPCWDPRIVAVCVFMKISLCKTYDGIEAYLKSNTFVAQRLALNNCKGIAFTITDWKGSDAKEFKRLIRDLPHIRKAAGDKAYSSRVNCQAADKGGKPFLCFKANATAKAKGYPAWQISFEACV